MDHIKPRVLDRPPQTLQFVPCYLIRLWHCSFHFFIVTDSWFSESAKLSPTCFWQVFPYVWSANLLFLSFSNAPGLLRLII